MNKLIRTALYGPQLETREEVQPLEERAFVTDLGVAFAAYLDSVDANLIPDYGLPAAYRGAQILADTVASLPLQNVRESTGEVKSFTPKVISQPEVGETYHDSMAKLMYSLVFDGNAYLLPMTRNTAGEVTSIHIANPGEVQVSWDKKQIFREYSWRNQDMEADKDIIHIALNKYPGALKGIGPFTACRIAGLSAKAEQNFGYRLFEDEATPSMAINVPQPLTQDEANAIQAQWENAHKNRKHPAIVSGGVTVQPLTINPVDAEFLATRKFSVQEYARMLGIPAFMLSVEAGDSLTYSTTESLFRLFLMSTLNPTYLERIEQAFSKLLPSGELARFDTSELLRADAKSRYDGYAVALGSAKQVGWLTPNEVREAEGLAPIPEPAVEPVIEEDASSE